MAIPGVSPGDPDAVRPVPEGSEDKFGAHATRAWKADNPDIGRVLQSAHTSQVGRSVSAPVAKKSRDLWLPVIHYRSPKTKSRL